MAGFLGTPLKVRTNLFSDLFILLFLFNLLFSTHCMLLTYFIVFKRYKPIYVVICKCDLEKTFFHYE